MEIRFSNVFFACVSAASADIFENYDVYTGKVQKDTKSKIPLDFKYGVLFCHRLQK